MTQPFELAVDGMHCQGCVRRVKAALAEVPGVSVLEVAIGKVRGTVDGEPAAVVAALEAAGYKAASPASS
ncbi:MAG TPA: heavy metal-associated domain-containing protein [Kofleriaceae bacterium]|nr:heavy metal-associated domain-containing protein [Kofleriaceae bacterium]